ncbi:hypothetical protein DB346_02555 [Verrucomicrobia bacterium LW23]|nr:hypothetical protein DB346_04100 [Verrucomicrobia bacterium LW23]PTY04329.1 hypothetical protein DB346_02555 [Verrucomicrobia bacterium LW23]
MRSPSPALLCPSQPHRPRSFAAREACRHAARLCALAVTLFLAAVCAVSSRAQQQNTEPPLLIKTEKAIEQRVPLPLYVSSQSKAAISPLRLRWDYASASSSMGDDVLVFRFPDTQEGAQLNVLKSQLWISALSSAIVWQEPWRASRWTVREIPEVDGPGVGVALSVGMIATASDVVFPKDTVIIGSLNPDTSLGPVNGMASRLDAAAAAGMKRVVIPNLQRFEKNAAGETVSIENYAKTLGLEIIFASDLLEATEKTLRCKLPAPPSTTSGNGYRGALWDYLNNQCSKEMNKLQTVAGTWQRNLDRLDKTGGPELKTLWRELFDNYDEGMDAYQAGLLYVSWGKLQMANAKWKAVQAWRNANLDFKTVDARATQLIARVRELMYKPPVDNNELHSGVCFAETHDWGYAINARLEGSQIFAQQAFHPRSTATEAQKELAITRMFTAVEETEYLVQSFEAYKELYPLVHKDDVAVYNRATVWLQQLIPTQIGASELFAQGLKHNANQLGNMILLDPRLSTYARVMEEIQKEWESRVSNALSMQSNTKIDHNVGWQPSGAYARPRSTNMNTAQGQLVAAAVKLSDTSRCLKWVNDYCEVSVLDHKYLKMGGYFDSARQEWVIPQQATLQAMTQYADVAARRGIAMAELIGLNTNILELVYERASYLRSSRRMDDKLEALRQFWRCALLGNMCWQLGYVPKASAMPAGPPPPSRIPPIDAPLPETTQAGTQQTQPGAGQLTSAQKPLPSFKSQVQDGILLAPAQPIPRTPVEDDIEPVVEEKSNAAVESAPMETVVPVLMESE